jgi:hypothetical protein
MSEADRGPQAATTTIAPMIPVRINRRETNGRSGLVKPLMSERYSRRQKTAVSEWRQPLSLAGDILSLNIELTLIS